LVETDITDLAQAASRIEALRSLILIFLREVDSLKRVVGPRPRKKGDPIKLDREIDAFEASLIRDALVKTKGNQRDAAKLLSIKPTTLNAKIKRLRIHVETTVTAVD
jgi:DNA-binding NtrC family response regulator